jgi:hypothetical protein
MGANVQTCFAIAAAAVLAGCATARVSDAAYASAKSARPVEILVDVSTEAISDAAQASVAETVRADLQADLMKELTSARVFAEPLTSGTQHAGAAVLHVTVTEAAPGNPVKRFVIGLGAGRAQLRAAAELRIASAGGDFPLVSFNTSSDSGRKPGLIVPGSLALATGKVVHLAIAGGLDVAMNARGGFDRPLKATARTVVGQLKKYYGSVGWYWPTADQAQHS